MLPDRPQAIIIIPCYNEAERLPTDDLKAFARAHHNIRLLLVDDGSSDQTWEIISAAIAECPLLQGFRLKKNQGKAEAVRMGILKAMEEAPEWVGFWDADLATPLHNICDFLTTANANGYQAVIGCRLRRLGARVNRKISRHYLGRLFATVVSMLLRLGVYDTQCGAKLFAATTVNAVFDRPFRSRWLFDVEILRRYVAYFGHEWASDMICEFPLNEWEDVSGSKLKMKHMLLVPWELFKIFSKKP